MKIKTYLDSKIDTEGRKVIMFLITMDSSRKRISTKIKVHEDYWDGKEILHGILEPYSEDKNNLLSLKKSCFSKIRKYCEVNDIPLTLDRVAEMYREYSGSSKKSVDPPKEEKKPDELFFTDLVDQVKEWNKNRWSNGKSRQLNQVSAGVERFHPKMKVTEINFNWLQNYCDFLVSEGKENNTIKSNHIKNIKIICGFAKKRLGINVPDDVEDFSWFATKKQNFTPTRSEIEKIIDIENLTLTEKHIRDTFIVSCFTGLRESDLRDIKLEMIGKQKEQNFLRVVMEKTGLDYSIPISDKVWEILKSYDFSIPKYSQQTYNRTIKKIADKVVNGVFVKYRFEGKNKVKKLVKRADMFTTHTARRFFGRNWIDSGGSVFILMKILGHGSIETTLRYIGYQPEEITNEFKKVMGML